MTAPRMFRSLAAALFAVCVGLATLPGCGDTKPQPSSKDEKKDDPKSDPNPASNPNTNPGPNPNTKVDVPPKSTLGAVEGVASAAATQFRTKLIQGVAPADALSATFLKTVGKPLVFPSDKEKGYSANEAASWLRNMGARVVGFGPEMKAVQAGDAVYLRGALQPKGGYCLRLIKESGAWKVDWFSLSTVDPEKTTLTTAPTPEGEAQGFAVVAFIETVAADPNVYPITERASLISAALSPTLRTAWASPFSEDTAAGLDYSPGKLGTKAAEIGGGTTGFTAARVGDLSEFKVELTKLAGKKTYVVKLVKGTGSNEWLVNEVTEAKG